MKEDKQLQKFLFGVQNAIRRLKWQQGLDYQYVVSNEDFVHILGLPSNFRIATRRYANFVADPEIKYSQLHRLSSAAGITVINPDSPNQFNILSTDAYVSEKVIRPLDVEEEQDLFSDLEAKLKDVYYDQGYLWARDYQLEVDVNNPEWYMIHVVGIDSKEKAHALASAGIKATRLNNCEVMLDLTDDSWYTTLSINREEKAILKTILEPEKYNNARLGFPAHKSGRWLEPVVRADIKVPYGPRKGKTIYNETSNRLKKLTRKMGHCGIRTPTVCAVTLDYDLSPTQYIIDTEDVTVKMNSHHFKSTAGDIVDTFEKLITQRHYRPEGYNLLPRPVPKKMRTKRKPYKGS